jgi:hypothetical protein
MLKKIFSKKIVSVYCIRNKEGDYWNNEFGWIHLENKQDDNPFSIFTKREAQMFNLPIEGHWEKLK